MDSLNVPVLLVTFDRPDTTAQVIARLRQVRPKVLYFFSDGPRAKNYPADLKNILEVRDLSTHIDWDCTLNTRFLDANQGCGPGVSQAISWAFTNEDRLIILEDDCVPSVSFFPFCSFLLDKYESDTRIMHISGTRWNEEFPITQSDYFFSKYAHIWGWATWKRSWDLYDYEMKDWPRFRQLQLLHSVENRNPAMVKRWLFLFDNIFNLKIKHTWDYQWQFAIFKHNGFCLNSTLNLVSNIGVQGVHSTHATNEHNRLQYETSEVLRSPEFEFLNSKFDKYHSRRFFLKDRGVLKVWFDKIEHAVLSIFSKEASQTSEFKD